LDTRYGFLKKFKHRKRANRSPQLAGFHFTLFRTHGPLKSFLIPSPLSSSGTHRKQRLDRYLLFERYGVNADWNEKPLDQLVDQDLVQVPYVQFENVLYVVQMVNVFVDQIGQLPFIDEASRLTKRIKSEQSRNVRANTYLASVLSIDSKSSTWFRMHQTKFEK
jgi:hypothetical protein